MADSRLTPVDYDPFMDDSTGDTGYLAPVDYDPFVDDGATFGESFGRGIDLAQGMGYGFVEASGEAIGSDALMDFGRRGRERNEAEAALYGHRASFEDIEDIGDFGQWVKETVGEQIPMMAPSLAGGVTGATIGLASPFPGGAAIGALIGAFAPSFVLGVGETQANIKERGGTAPGHAFLGGSAIAALDTILPGKIGGKLVARFGKETAEQIARRTLTKPVRSAALRIGREGAKGMATEGLTEALQEAVGEVAAAKGTDTDINWENLKTQMIEAGAAGALMGGGVSGITAAIPEKASGERAKAAQAPIDISQDDIDSPIPTDLIAEGKTVVRDATASQKADTILRRNDLPNVGQQVEVAFPDGTTFTGTMEDATEADGDGYSVTLDDGRSMDIPVSPDVVVTPVRASETTIETNTQAVADEILDQLAEIERDAARERAAIETDEAPIAEVVSPEPVLSPVAFDPFAETAAPAQPWQPHYESAVKYAREGDGGMNALQMGQALGVDGNMARRVLDAMAARGVIKKTQKGYRRPQMRKGPIDILTFIADRGGIRDDEGHDLKKGRDGQRFIPQAGPLIRKDGLSVDYAREAAAEAGYNVGPDTASFLAVMDNAWDGQKGYTPEDAVIATEQDAATEAHALYEDQFESPGEAESFEAMVEEQRALEESAFQGYNDATKQAAEHLAPEEIFPQGKPRTLEGLEQIDAEIERSERDGRELGAPVEGPKAAREPTTEVLPDRFERATVVEIDPQDISPPAEPSLTTETIETVDGKREQAVIPGAEKISDKEFVERQMEDPKKTGTPQKDADEGLFDVEGRKRTDLLDMAPVSDKGTKLFSVTPVFQKVSGEFMGQAERLFRKIAGDEAGLEFRDAIEADEGGARQSGGVAGPAAGVYDPSANLAALSMSYGDPVNTAAHEGWRVLKNTKFFSKGEKKALADGKAGFEKTAREMGLNPETMSDESLEAVAFAKWTTDKTAVKWNVRHAFNRVKKFLDKMARWLKVKGIKADDVFEKAAKGEIAKRATTKDAKPGTAPKYSVTVMALDRRERFPWVKDRVKGSEAEEAAILATMEVAEHVPLGERVRALISTTKENLETKAVQHTLDQFESIRRLEVDIKGKVGAASVSPYKATRLTQNLHSSMAAVLRHGPLRYEKGGFVVADGFEGGFEGIFEGLAERGLIHLWKGWAMANRAKRLKAEGRENNMSDAQIQTLINLENKHPEFRTVMKKWQRFNKAMLDMIEEAGLINADQRAIWENDDYVPFYRVMDEHDQGPGKKGGITGQRSGIKTLRGGEAIVGDILENMVLNMTHMVDAAFKNIAAQRVVDMVEEAGMSDGSVIEPVGMDWTTAHVPASEAANKLKEIGIDIDNLAADQKDHWLKLFTIRPPKDPDVISVMKNGKPQYYRVNDPLLLSALTSMRYDGPNTLMNILRAPKRWMTVGITTFPGFMLRNFVRDSLHSWTVTGKDFLPFKDSASGFKKSLMESPSLAGIMAAGGGSGGYYRTDPADVRKLMDAKLRGVSSGAILDTPKKLWEMWRRIGQASENANRIAVYDAVLKETGDKSEAAYQAMDLLDFSMKGDARLIRFLIETVPFLNARAQGLYKMGRGAKENPRSFMLRGAAIAAATLGLVAMNWDDERYDDLPEWEKDIYYHVFLDNIFSKAALELAGINTDDWHIKIPKPFEVGAIFSTVPERFIRALAGKDETNVTAKRTVAMFRDTFAMDLPQFAKPLMEQAANRNFFRDRPIVSQRFERLSPEAQSDSRTSEAAKWLGEALPDFVGDAKSPKRIDALVRGYLANIGTYILMATDMMLEPGDAPPKPEMRLDRIPELGGFFRNHPAFSTKWTSEFYDTRREVQELVATIRHYRKNGNIDRARALVRDEKTQLGARRMLENAGKALTGITNRIRKIEQDKNLSPGGKRLKLDALFKKRNALTKKVMLAFRGLENMARK